MSCLKFSFFSYILSCVWLLTNVLLVELSTFCGTMFVRSRRSTLMVVFILPNATTAFFPFTSRTSPTEFCPFIFTIAPGTMLARRSASCLAFCAACSCADNPLSVSLVFFSFLRFCFSCNFCILRAIFSSCSLEARASID